jgi:hypothetical protein
MAQMAPGFRGRQQILRTGQFVVPAKAVTQGKQVKSPGSRFRGNDGYENEARDFLIGLQLLSPG